jgi:recombination protein RecA
MTTTKESNQRINITTRAIEKEYGHVIKWLGDAAEEKREYLSSGCLGLDNAVGNGGFERGLILEVFGPEGVGKSFLGYSIMREACALGHKCAIVDAENSLDPNLLLQIGLPSKQVLIVDGAPTGEANLSIAQSLMGTGEFAVVMIDSVAALVPEARMEADFDQQSIGLHARLLSAGIQKILPIVKKTNTLLIFVNQIRNKIGSYGNPETTTGGKALPFYAAYRIEIRGGQSKASKLEDAGGEVYGHRTTFKVVKNKRAAPWRTAEVDLIYGLGYDTDGELLDLGVDMGLIEKGGAWFTYGDHKWQGRDKAKLALQKDISMKNSLEAQLRLIITGEIIDTPVEPKGVENDVVKVNGDTVDDKSPSKKRTRKSTSSAT